MREIKFRAWDESEKRFYYFTIGQGNENFTRLGIYDRLCLNGTEFKQFTGLHDKNGKEIYEGDILKWSNGYDHSDYFASVIFSYGCFVSSGYGGTQFIKRFSDSGASYTYEVIGNIHENPELLK